MSFANQLFCFVRRSVIGQDRAIQELIQALVPRLSNDISYEKTGGAFLLVGPSGTGKTRLAECLAEFFLGDSDRLLRLNCLLLQQTGYSIKLLSSHFHPPNRARAVATAHEPLVDHVVLLENIERSSKTLINFWNYVLTHGHIGLDGGAVLSFRRTVFLLKSAVGEKEIDQLLGVVGFGDSDSTHKDGELRDVINRSIETTFPGRFMMNLTRVVHFRQLQVDDLLRILDRLLEDFCLRLRASGIELNIDPWVRELILERSLQKDRLRGAKALRQVIMEELFYPIQDLSLSGRLHRPCHIWVKRGERAFVFFVPEPAFPTSNELLPALYPTPFAM